MSTFKKIPLLSREFPLYFFVVVFLLSCLIFWLNIWQDNQQHAYAEKMTRIHLDLVQDIGRANFFDEGLTMSARLVAATGNFEYERRYNQLDSGLSDLIRRTEFILPEHADLTKKLTVANDALVKIERDSFALAHQGKFKEASVLLSSAEYANLKESFAVGVQSMEHDADAYFAAEKQKNTQQLQMLGWVNIASAFILFIAWFFAFRAVRERGKNRSTFDTATRVTQGDLEARVLERTRELGMSNALLLAQREASIDAVLVVGVDTRVLSYNQQFVDLWKLPPRDIHEGADEQVLQGIANREFKDPSAFIVRAYYLLEHHEVKSHDVTELKDGRIINWYSAPVKGSDGTYYGRVWYLRDVTEHVQKEQKIVASELRYRRLFEAARDGILILDAETGLIVDVNPFLVELLGFSREEFLSKKIWEIGFFKDVFANQEQFVILKEKGYVRYEDLPLETEQGIKAHVEFVSNVYLVEGKKVVQCNIRDITERKRLETALGVEKVNLLASNKDLEEKRKVLEEAYIKDEALLTSLVEGVIVTDYQGVVVLVNRAAKEMLGLSEEELMGKVFVDTVQALDERGEVVPHEQRPLVVAGAVASEVGECSMHHPVPASLYYVRKDGERVPVSVVATPVVVAGVFVAIMMTFRDTTTEKETERSREDLLMLASHQLRTPLSGTKWLIETLRRGIVGEMNKEQKEYLDQIYKVNERMTTLVVEMLNVIRMEGNTIPVHKALVSTKAIFEAVFEIFNPVAQSRQIVLRIEQGEECMIETDALLLRNILESFVTNALMYSNPGTEVVILLEKKPNEIVIAVRDSGIGISEDERKHLFKRFYRTSSAKTFNTNGKGLGLYIAAVLAKKIGATISFDSVEGKGSTFYVSVPTP